MLNDGLVLDTRFEKGRYASAIVQVPGKDERILVEGDLNDGLIWDRLATLAYERNGGLYDVILADPPWQLDRVPYPCMTD